MTATSRSPFMSAASIARRYAATTSSQRDVAFAARSTSSRRARVAREQLEGREVALEGLLRVLDLALVERGHLAVELELRRSGSSLVTELDLDRVGERLGVVGLRVDGDEGLGGLQVVGLELEHLLVRLGGAIELLLLVRPELRDLEEQRDLRLRASLLRLLLLEDADELVPLAALGVEDLEVVPAAERQVLLLERVLRAAIVGVQGEQRAPGVDRALVVVEAVAVDRAELGEDLTIFAGASNVISACRSSTLASFSKSLARS